MGVGVTGIPARRRTVKSRRRPREAISHSSRVGRVSGGRRGRHEGVRGGHFRGCHACEGGQSISSAFSNFQTLSLARAKRCTLYCLPVLHLRGGKLEGLGEGRVGSREGSGARALSAGSLSEF